MKKNCWELKDCGREPGGRNSAEFGVCPAASNTMSDGINGGINGGRLCWAVAGTVCNGIIQGSFAQKQGSCLCCTVFKQVKEEEGQKFTMIPPGQREHQSDKYVQIKDTALDMATTKITIDCEVTSK